MILKIGTTPLDQNEVNVRRVEKGGILGPRGTFLGSRERWLVQGKVRADSQAALKTKVDDRKTLFSPANYDRDVEFFFNNGSSSSGDKLVASGSANGVVISPVVWGEPQFSPMTEWVAYRTYSFTIEAEYPLNSNTIISYVETVELIGDGSPDYVVLEFLTEVPVAQFTKATTKVAFRQWGRAVGLLDYPTYPIPVGTPKPHGGIRLGKQAALQVGRKVSRGFGITWSYYGEGPTAFPPFVFGP